MMNYRLGTNPGMCFTKEILMNEIKTLEAEFAHIIIDPPLPKNKNNIAWKTLCEMLSAIRLDARYTTCSSYMKNHEKYATRVKKYGSTGQFRRDGKGFTPFTHRLVVNRCNTVDKTFDLFVKNVATTIPVKKTLSEQKSQLSSSLHAKLPVQQPQ